MAVVAAVVRYNAGQQPFRETGLSEIETVDVNEMRLNEAQALALALALALAVAKLADSNVAEIDNALYEHAIDSWRKVAMVIGLTMIKVDGQFGAIPDSYYLQRVAKLAELGRLEAQGELWRMGRSEVRRLPGV